ncbi:MAG: hypothetical protein RIE06_01735 [Roseibium album]|uniref:hypothetical protein n=1 Tax=Roseibium album TaxID=311410 RepID=UPI0032EC415B
MSCEDVAKLLAKLYDEEFGGKTSGRYRVPQKLLREMLGRKRLYETDVSSLSRAVFEEGFVLIDMDSFYVVMSANSFVNYRRVGKEDLGLVE